MSLIEQWANNLDVTEPVNGSWIEAIRKRMNALQNTYNTIFAIGKKIGITSDTGDYYHDIAIKLSNDENVRPLNGSYLERIVDLTTP
jgi:hypothetical protein